MARIRDYGRPLRKVCPLVVIRLIHWHVLPLVVESLMVVLLFSEFGMPAMPDMRTIRYWMGSLRDDPRQNFAQSKIMAQHCRAGMFERRFAIPMNEMFRLTEDLET